MKAVSGELPTDEQGWTFEVKWDGMRVLAYAEPSGPTPMKLITTNGKDATASFPELWPMADALGGRAAILDGEVVAFAAPTSAHAIPRPDFGRLQQRMHVTNVADARRRAATVPVSFMAFDLLHLDDTSLLTVPYRDRRRLLRELLPDGPAWSVPADWSGTGADLLALARTNGLEGVLAKRADSSYQPGKRSPTWRKVKVRLHQEFVVGGWTDGGGGRSGVLGALLMGVTDDQPRPGQPLRLRYVGRVGTGFDAAELGRLGRLLGELAASASPFINPPADPALRTAHFVRPELVVEVAFGEWTSEGLLRHPSYLGQRLDKEPIDVRQEPIDVRQEPIGGGLPIPDVP